MTKEEARARIAALSEELEQHNYNYYIFKYEFREVVPDFGNFLSEKERIRNVNADVAARVIEKLLKQRTFQGTNHCRTDKVPGEKPDADIPAGFRHGDVIHVTVNKHIQNSRIDRKPRKNIQ